MGVQMGSSARRLTGRRRFLGPLVALAVGIAAAPAWAQPLAGTDRDAASTTRAVVVRELAPGSDAAERAVRAVGGSVTTPLPIVDGFSAQVPVARLDALRRSAGVRSVDLAAPVHFDGAYGQGSRGPSAVYSDAVRADRAWSAGHRGQGIGVAVIDTGVNAVGDLAGRVSHSADFTADGDGVDRFGHGTFVAGLVAGTGATGTGVRGVAPAAHVISLKIAGRNGSADITHVMAALQYAVSFKDVYDIDVVNLSLGTDSTQDTRIDPLNMAVERAWAAGLVVVVSASNRGPDAGTVTKPADDPWVITVGSAADASTPGIADDTVPAFSAAGPTRSNGIAKPDLVAPGGSVVSTRAVGSTIDQEHAGARIGTQHFVGSGTSFSSGVVSGAAALVLSRTPSLTPDQVKARLVGTARPGPVTDVQRVGAGWLDAAAATLSNSTAAANAGLPRSDGSGSLELSRGSMGVQIQTGVVGSLLGPVPVLTTLTGAVTAQDRPFDLAAYRDGAWTAPSWSGSQWYGSQWYGSQWYGSQWYGSQWYADQWG